MNNLNVALVELDTVLADVDTNLKICCKMLQTVSKDSDVIVLPELFSTGFIADQEMATQLAEDNEGQTMGFIAKEASNLGMAICGSFLAKTGEKLYNRAFFMEPSGEVHFYDKRHLFMLSEESKILHKGMQLPFVVRFRGWNISMMVCYDLRFPAWGRNTDLKYDLMILPANWPDKRAYAWQTLLKSRAIENQAYYVGCNRGGCDDYGCYAHESHIIDFMGKPMGNWNDKIFTGTLALDKLAAYREKFPAWESMDKIEIDL